MAKVMQLGPVVFGVLYECDWCDGYEERVFTDSTTGMDLCLECLSKTAPHITMSPSETGDNLRDALTKHVGAQCKDKE